MTVMYDQYEIEIKNHGPYTYHPQDSNSVYPLAYPTTLNAYQPSSNYGIHVQRDGGEIKRAMLHGFGGGTAPHENAIALVNSKLIVCCGDSVCALALPDLNLLWRKNLDPATCFALHPFKDDFIIHGELLVTGIDEHGTTKWDFGARDIFVLPDGRDALRIVGDQILLLDWNGHEYILNEYGQQIE